MTPDDQLIQGCINGDRQAQRQLYDTYARRMFGVCLRYTKNREEAEEVLQEGLLKVFNKIGDFKKAGSLESWIKRIIINTSLDFYRRDKSRQMETEWRDDLTISVEPMNDLKAKELLKVIQSLPAGFRTVFNLFAVEGYSHSEIASMLNISEGTSKSQYARARQHLMKIINIESKTGDAVQEPKNDFETKTIPFNII